MRANAVNLSPEPLVEAFDRFSGSLTDLELGVTVGSTELKQSLHKLARLLSEAGVQSGDRIILSVANGPRFLAAFGATLTIGASPLLVHFQSPPAELNRIGARYQAKFLLCDQWTIANLAPNARTVHQLETTSWAKWQLAEQNVNFSLSDSSFPALSAVPLHPTSGTSGEPKIAVRPASTAVAEAVHYIESIGINDQDTILAAVPMSHAYGFGMCAMVPLLCGAKVVSIRSFNPKLALRALQQEGVTLFPAVPAMLDILTKDSNAKPFDRPIRVFTAGSVLSEAVANAFKERYGAGIHPLYGTTETGGISVARSAACGPDVNAVGPPLDGVSVDFVVHERQESVSNGIGSLRVRSDSMMAGYLAPGGIDASMLEDGCFDVGDLASLDDESVIRLYGRDSDVINIFGMKVLPYEVEEVIKGMVDVKEVIVYKGLHRSGSQLVKTAIVPIAEGTLDIAQVRSYCEQNLSPYKRPQIITLLGSLPKTASGKVIRDQLP